MSLKAKIEAVIYAAEEPVTLSQLVAIFAAEVPVAETTVVETVSPYEDAAAGDAASELPLIAPLLPPEPGHEITTIDEAGTMQDLLPVSSESAETAETETADASTSDAELEAAAKRATRQREREIRDYLRSVVDELVADYVLQDRGIEIREIAGGFRMATKPEYHDSVRAFVKSLKPVMKLSPQALETLAVIAYKQPVTAPEVGEIRGVDSGGVLASLISRKLVTTAGRKQVIGRPILYKTTKEFLLRFGLKDLAELPSTEEFEKMAVELAASEDLEDAALEGNGGEHGQQGADALPFEEGAASETSTAALEQKMDHESTSGAELNEVLPDVQNNAHAEELETVPEMKES